MRLVSVAVQLILLILQIVVLYIVWIFWKVLVCCSGHAKFQAQGCSHSLRLAVEIFLKFEVGSCFFNPDIYLSSESGLVTKNFVCFYPPE